MKNYLLGVLLFAAICSYKSFAGPSVTKSNLNCFIEEFLPKEGLKRPYVLNCGAKKCLVAGYTRIAAPVQMRLIFISTSVLNAAMNERVTVANFGTKNHMFTYDPVTLNTSVEQFFRNIQMGAMTAEGFMEFVGTLNPSAQSIVEIKAAFKKYGPKKTEKFLYKFNYDEFKIFSEDCNVVSQ